MAEAAVCDTYCGTCDVSVGLGERHIGVCGESPAPGPGARSARGVFYANLQTGRPAQPLTIVCFVCVGGWVGGRGVNADRRARMVGEWVGWVGHAGWCFLFSLLRAHLRG